MFFPDIEDQTELMHRAIYELAQICKPQYNYKAKITDLRTLPEYNHEDFAVGDMADAIQAQIGINDRVRIIRHKYNLFQPWDCELELGNPEKRFEKMIADNNKATSNFNNSVMPGVKIINGRIVTMQTAINQTNEAIILKADKTVTDGLNTRLTSAETKITAEAIVSTVRSSISYINDLSGKAGTGVTEGLNTRLTSAESSITQNANEIALKVSSTDYNGNTIASLINQSDTTITIEASKINLYGYITATSLSTPGATIINGSNITTGTITGVTMRTAADGARIELSGNKLVTYNSGGLFNGPYINPSDGSLLMYNNGKPVFAIDIDAAADGCKITSALGSGVVLGDTGENVALAGNIFVNTQTIDDYILTTVVFADFVKANYVTTALSNYALTSYVDSEILSARGYISNVEDLVNTDYYTKYTVDSMLNDVKAWATANFVAI
jgi:hypothetical protein